MGKEDSNRMDRIDRIKALRAGAPLVFILTISVHPV
jgi:hypothetical protein